MRAESKKIMMVEQKRIMDPTEAQQAINKITTGLSDTERRNLEEAPLPQMISFMSSQVMEMMQSGEFDKSINMITEALQDPQGGGPANILEQLQKLNIPEIRNNIKEDPIRVEDEASDEGDDPEDIKPRTPDLCYTINVPLKDLYTGKKKKVKIVRNNFRKKEDGTIETFEERKKLLIPITKGSKHGDKIVFAKESSKLPDYEPGDVVITLSMEPDELFERIGNNLFIYKNLSVSENYNLNQQITHLDGRIITIKQSKEDTSIVHKCHGMRKIIGEGMPIKGTEKKGDLYIRFNLALPEKISEEQIQKLDTIFEKEPVALESSEDPTRTLQLELINDTDFSILEDTWSESDYSTGSETDSETDSELEEDPDIELEVEEKNNQD